MTKMIRRISAVILVMAMLIGVLPLQVMAEGETVNTQEATYASLEVGKEYTVTIDENGAKEIWYQFTPAESGYYTAYANGEFDSYCELYNSNNELLEFNDDDGENSNFSLQYEMTAGTTYYYKFRMYSETVYGSYKVNLVKNVPAASMNIGYSDYTAYVGSYLYLSADFEPELAVIEEVSWTSSNEEVASVSEYGDVQLLSEGTAVITATSESGLVATCTVTVKPAMDAVLDTTYTITTDGESITEAMYKFVPEKSGYYRFYSYNGECDTEGTLYDEYFNKLKYDDQSGEASHFAIDYELEAGKTYYINVSPYYEDKASFDFRIREITPTILKDAYFTVDNEKKEEFGFSVAEANEVTLWFELSKGDDMEISSLNWWGECINQDFAVESMSFTAEYDNDTNLYYTKIPLSYYKDGCEFYVSEISLTGTDDDIKYLNNINGESIDNIYYLMGEGVATKTYDVYFSVAGDSSEVSVTTSRITSLSEMGIEIPTVPVFEGAEFLGWELTINGITTDIIKSNDEKFAVTDLFNQENGLTNITLSALYDKNIVIGDFNYINKDGESAEISIETAVNKNSNTTIAQWLESVVSGDLLSDIEHTSNMTFEGWDTPYNDPEYVINSTYTIIEVEADYSFEGIVLGGVNIKNGDYLNNVGEVSKTMPEGGYAYYSDGKLTLHNYRYKGEGNNIIDESCALYVRSDLEIVPEGSNSIHCMNGDVIYNEEGNLTISGDGYLDLKTYGSYDGIDLVNGDLTIKSGTVSIESGDHGCEIDGAITIDGGIIKIKAGDDGMDFEDDFIINDGIVDIDTEDIGIDSSANVYVKGGFIRVKTEDDEGFEAAEKIVIEDGNITIDSNGPGLYAWEDVEINGGYTQIKSGDYAVISDWRITFGDKMESFETIQLDEYMIGIGINGEVIKEAVLKSKDATKLSYLDESWVSLSEEKIVYTGEEIKPVITINDGDKALVEGTDYTISYSNEEIKDIGEYLIVITGKGSYSGVVIKKITVFEDIIFVGNTWMENGDYLPVGATETVDEEPETDGYAYYKDGVLELNNYQYEGSGYEYDPEGYCSVIYSENSIGIELVGENSIINSSPDGEGITAYGSLKFNGNGSIYIEALYGIGNYEGDIVIESGDISISADYDAIWGYEEVIINDGNIDISAGSCCIYSEGDLMINGGTLNLKDAETGEENNYAGYGIYCDYGDITIGGDADITIDTETGIFAYDYDIIMDGGKVDITADCGIWCDYSDVYINGGILNINAAEGVTSYNDLMFNGGVVNINSTEYAAEANNIELGKGMSIIKPKTGTIKTVEDSTYIFEGDGYALDVIIMSFESITKLIEGKTADNVTSDDKKSIQNVIELIDDLLTEEGWTAEENEFLENTKADATVLIEKIDSVAGTLATDNIQKVEGINEQNVVLENRDDLASAKEELENALEENGGNYTAEEKQDAEAKIETINKALEVIENVQEVEQEISDLPDVADPLDDATVELIKSAIDNYDNLSDYEKTLVSDNLKEKLELLSETLNAGYVTVYFDNSETNWSDVVVLYEDSNGELIAMGSVIPDDNGICTIKVPEDSKIQICNYSPGQPPEAAPPEGFLQTDLLTVVEGTTYKYEPVESNVLLGDVNQNTKINAQDALLVLKHSAKIAELSGDSLTAADVTFDGNINASDALEILKYAANIITGFEK